METWGLKRISACRPWGEQECRFHQRNWRDEFQTYVVDLRMQMATQSSNIGGSIISKDRDFNQTHGFHQEQLRFNQASLNNSGIFLE